MITLVTGCNSGIYFFYLNQVLDNIIDVAAKTNTKIRIIVYDLGLNTKETSWLMLKYKINVVKFDFAKYPDHVSLEKFNGHNCTYAWKPIIIHEVCEKYGGLVHWMDTKNLYINFSNLTRILNVNYIYTPSSGPNVRRWTHPTCLKAMEGERFLDKLCRNGAAVAINYNIAWCRDLVREWRDYALRRECIAPECSDRSNHRQDQAVLTILYYKYQEKYNFIDIDYYIDLKIHNKLKLKYIELANNFYSN